MMQEEIKCPQCGGNRFNQIDEHTYKCLYCGTTFQKKEERVEHVSQTPPVPADTIGEPMPSAGAYYQVNKPMYGNYAQSTSKKSKTVAALLAIFLGGFGIHKFYLRKPGWGIAYLIFCWSYIPAIIGFIEGIILLAMSEDDFDYKYNF